MKLLPLIYFSLVLLLCSCSSKKDKDRFYHVLGRGYFTETRSLDSLDLREPKHKLLYQKEFFHGKHAGVIKKFENSPAPVDGECIFYWNQAVGIFYQRNIWWKNYIRLRSTNDSIDDYISTMIDHILADPNLFSNPEPIKDIILPPDSI